jgi:hypothetical protein
MRLGSQWLKRLVGAVGAFACAGATPSLAADLTDKVPGHPNLSYFDLMKLVVPDLAKDNNGAGGHHIVPFRHIAGKDAKTDVGDDIQIIQVDPITITGQSDRLILLADGGSSDESVAEIEFLGLFELTPKPRLIDMVEVGTDRFIAVKSTTPPLLAPGSPLIVIDSDHFNSNEDYNSGQMIFVRNDRFEPIDSIFTYSSSLCSFQTQQEASITPMGAAAPYRSVRVVVRQTVKLTGDDGCNDDEKPPRPKRSTYAATYRWDAGRQRFIPDSKALETIQAASLRAVNAP